MIGTLLNDRYRLDAELGRGGMGVVYRAHDTLLDRSVAVKVLSGSRLTAEGRSRLLNEARAAAQLNHPNIVTIYDAGEAPLDLTGLTDPSGLIPFIVMELVEGESLFGRRPQTLDEVLAVAREVCAALEHAHTRAIVHRDLKPENVVLSPLPSGEGPGVRVKLMDFGLARSLSSRLTAEGTIVGTVFYLAPELALGQPFDGRADLYALGVMLYELTAGRLPFTADDPLAVISQHLHAPVVPPGTYNSGIPPALDALIVRLLSKRPGDRPTAAAQVSDALERIAEELRSGATVSPLSPITALERLVLGRLMGRERELAQAKAIWHRAASGEAQLLLVSGEPGIGKTRLVREIATFAEVSGALALAGECYAEGGAPYGPVAQMIQGALEGEGKTVALPALVLADLITLVPALRARFPDVPPNPRLNPQAERQRLFESVTALCVALTANAPILLTVEDAHWADGGSLLMLRHLARRGRAAKLPILVVLTYREVDLDEGHPLNDMLIDLNRERLATR
ncbi:MAG: serine/threonine-protein kinase PknK, partial [Chloroflexi bacterium]|nr:serine/threonine-protein kinase PknK [Chloroflexota bacterium]